jgi:hypothetical protein
MHEITLEERFLFDLQGFLHIPNVLSADECESLIATIERVKERFLAKPEVVPEGRSPAFENMVPGQIRFNGLFRLDPAFDALIDQPTVLQYLKAFMDQPHLGNAWMIQKGIGTPAGGWHRGVNPIDYTFRNGKSRTRMFNIVYFLTDNGPEDGCMVAIPASHKSNIDLNWGAYPGLEMPGSVAITGKAGDAFMFSEATMHTGLPKTTPGFRTNLYFNYLEHDFNVMTFDATNANHRHYAMPPSIRDRWTPSQKEVTKWMEYAQTEE